VLTGYELVRGRGTRTWHACKDARTATQRGRTQVLFTAYHAGAHSSGRPHSRVAAPPSSVCVSRGIQVQSKRLIPKNDSGGPVTGGQNAHPKIQLGRCAAVTRDLNRSSYMKSTVIRFGRCTAITRDQNGFTKIRYTACDRHPTVPPLPLDIPKLMMHQRIASCCRLLCLVHMAILMDTRGHPRQLDAGSLLWQRFEVRVDLRRGCLPASNFGITNTGPGPRL
jgi:hypothetical protein